MILIKDVTKIFRNNDSALHAVDGVSLEIEEGQIYGIVGYSGAGKSTLVRCINLLEEPDSGSVSIKDFGTAEFKNGSALYIPEGGGEAVKLSQSHLKKLRREIGMIFQHFNLLDRNTVFENVAYPLKYTGLKKDRVKARVSELLELVDLKDKAYSYPCELSGGQKQRVAIARALANNPKILLSDEATSALDPDATESILKLLKELSKKLGLTVVLITHEMSVVKTICDRVAVMEKGKVVEEGSVYDVFSAPQKAITKKFVDSSSGLGRIDRFVEDGESVVSGEGILLKCVYGKDCVGEAVISEVSRTFDVNVNIILGNIEILQGSPLGGLIVLMSGNTENCESAMRYMRELNIKLEVIDHGSLAQ